MSDVSDEPHTRFREAAFDRSANESARVGAIQGLTSLGSRAAVEVLLELGSRQDEAVAVLRATGKALADVGEEGRVSEWDIRDLARPAAEAFFE